MDNDNIHLELSELPVDIAIDIERYLSAQYEDKDVIIHSNKSYSADNECSNPLTIKEIMKEIKLTELNDVGRVIAIAFHDNNHISIYQLTLINKYKIGVDVGLECIYDGKDSISIIYGPFSQRWIKEQFISNITNGSIVLDPFSEYRIRSKRDKCNEYAKKRLIKWYNIMLFKSIKTNEEITVDDIQSIIILNYITFQIPFEEGIREYTSGHNILGDYDLINQAKLKKHWIPIYQYTKDVLKNYIIKLTDAKLYKDKLVL